MGDFFQENGLLFGSIMSLIYTLIATTVFYFNVYLDCSGTNQEIELCKNKRDENKTLIWGTIILFGVVVLINMIYYISADKSDDKKKEKVKETFAHISLSPIYMLIFYAIVKFGGPFTLHLVSRSR